MSKEALGTSELDHQRHVLEVNNLSCGYRTPFDWRNPMAIRSVQWAFQDLSFRIAPNTYTALIGPSGSGKTTLFAALGFERPNGLVVNGKITYGGNDGDKKTKLAFGNNQGVRQIHIQNGVRKGSFYLIDEPFREKDPDEIINSIRSFAANKGSYEGGGVIFATHNLPSQLAELTDYILVLGENPRFGNAEEMENDEYVQKVLTTY